MFTCLTNRDVINDIKVYRTAVCIAQALVLSKAVIGTVEAKDRKVPLSRHSLVKNTAMRKLRFADTR